MCYNPIAVITENRCGGGEIRFNAVQGYRMKKYAIITMDVEDWYQSHTFPGEVDKSISMLDGMDVALDIMNARNIKGSFFVLGEIAESLRDKLRDMDRAGHDIACHGWSHARPLSLEPEEFRAQLLRARETLEAILGHPVHGYRGPCFAMDDERLEIVRSLGFQYDSSKLQPQRSSKYGALELPGYETAFPCVYRKGDFTEFEISTQRIGRMNMLLGGGYIRMLPWPFMKWMTQRYLDTGKPYVMYIHPIDLSPVPMPRVEGMRPNQYLRTHIGRRHMVRRFRRVIEMLERSGYTFVTFEQLRTLELR